MALGWAGKEAFQAAAGRVRADSTRPSSSSLPPSLNIPFPSLHSGCSMAVWASWQTAWWGWMISGRARNCGSGQAMTMWDGATRASPMATWRWSLSLTG